MTRRDRVAQWALAGLLAAGAGLAARAGSTPPAPAPPSAATAATSPLPARGSESGPGFASLGRAQQQVLAPLAPYWHTLDASRKEKWLEVARRFPTLPAAEQQRIQDRMAEWSRMTPAERGRARLQFQQARQISPDERPARWEAYQLLPSEEREALARRARPEPAPAAAAATRGLPAAARDDGLADASTAKRNIVTPRPPAPPKQVAPTMVQAKPGATTTLMTDKTAPPLHAQSGLPKIAAVQGFVDPRTLLPRRGPQGAGMAAPPAGPDASDTPR